jgi:predicted RNase H-like HicB family nuclease
VESAPDVQGKWVAHCLDFNTLAQADDPETAMRLVMEAAVEIVEDDLRDGVDPKERRATEDDWSILEEVATRGQTFASLQDCLRSVENRRPSDGEHWVIVAEFLMVVSKPAPAPAPIRRPAIRTIPGVRQVERSRLATAVC